MSLLTQLLVLIVSAHFLVSCAQIFVLFMVIKIHVGCTVHCLSSLIQQLVVDLAGAPAAALDSCFLRILYLSLHNEVLYAVPSIYLREIVMFLFV